MTHTPTQTMTITEALRWEVEHRLERPAELWSIKDALRWEAERAKEQR